MPSDKKKGGARYQIQSIINVITAKEAKGKSAKFERELLEAWAEYPGYKSAREALAKAEKA